MSICDSAEQLEWTADMRSPQVDDDLARLARLRAVQAEIQADLPPAAEGEDSCLVPVVDDEKAAEAPVRGRL